MTKKWFSKNKLIAINNILTYVKFFHPVKQYYYTSHLAIFTKQPQNLLQTLHFCMSLSKNSRTIVSVNFKLNEKILIKISYTHKFISHYHSLELVFSCLIALHLKPIMSNAQTKDSLKKLYQMHCCNTCRATCIVSYSTMLCLA